MEFLPTHTLAPVGGAKGIHAVASSPWGSAFILQISYAYMKLMGFAGLKEATIFAIMNANYLKNKLKNKFKILYVGKNGMVGHEFIVDCREFKKTAGVSEIDIAKRLIDYGYHAPTVSFPVPGTLMIEPTESESLHELDRFVEVMNNIYEEIQQIAKGEYDMKDNVFVNAPHTDQVIASDSWEHKYSRQKAAFPLPWIRENKFWPGSSRIDDAYGDRNLICSCTE